MKTFDIVKYIMPIYLLVVLLIQINLSIRNVMFVCLPILIIVTSIYFKNKKVGLFGIFLFYMLSFSTVVISDIEQYFQITLQIIFLIVPSLILLGQILGINNEKEIILKPTFKPSIISIVVFFIIIIICYIFCIFLWDGFLLFQENIEAQLLTLTALSIIFCLPFLITQKVKKDN